LFAVALMSTPCIGMTGKELSQLCDANSTFLEFARCVGYLEGFNDGMVGESSARTLESMTAPRPAKSVCVPEGVTLRQMRDIIMAHLTANPDDLRQFGSIFIRTALYEAYPCMESPR